MTCSSLLPIQNKFLRSYFLSNYFCFSVIGIRYKTPPVTVSCSNATSTQSLKKAQIAIQQLWPLQFGKEQLLSVWFVINGLVQIPSTVLVQHYNTCPYVHWKSYLSLWSSCPYWPWRYAFLMLEEMGDKTIPKLSGSLYEASAVWVIQVFPSSIK